MDIEEAKIVARQADMFGYDPLIKKIAGKFFVEFGALSIPTAFSTKDEAIQRARLCLGEIRRQIETSDGR